MPLDLDITSEVLWKNKKKLEPHWNKKLLLCERHFEENEKPSHTLGENIWKNTSDKRTGQLHEGPKT